MAPVANTRIAFVALTGVGLLCSLSLLALSVSGRYQRRAVVFMFVIVASLAQITSLAALADLSDVPFDRSLGEASVACLISAILSPPFWTATFAFAPVLALDALLAARTTPGAAVSVWRAIGLCAVPPMLATPSLVLATLEVVGSDAAPITSDVLRCAVASDVVRLVGHGVSVGALFGVLVIAVVGGVLAVRHRRDETPFATHHLVRLGSIGFLALAGTIIIAMFDLAGAMPDARAGSDLYTAAFPLVLLATIGIADRIAVRPVDVVEGEERLLTTQQRWHSLLSIQDVPLSAASQSFRFGTPSTRAAPTPPPMVAIPRLPLPPVYARFSSRRPSPALDTREARNTRYTTATVWSQASAETGLERTDSRTTTDVTLSTFFVRRSLRTLN